MIAELAPAPQPLHVQLHHLQVDMAAYLAERKMGRHAARHHGPRRVQPRKLSIENEKRHFTALKTAHAVEKNIIGGLHKRAEISKALRLSDSQVGRALRWLMEAGRIKRAKGGMYITAPKETTTPVRSTT